MIEVRPARLRDAADLAPRMRAADAAEVFAATGDGPFTALALSLALSTEAWAASFDGELTSLFGVAPLSESITGGKVGIVWLLSSDNIEPHAKEFHAACAQALIAMTERWDVLTNAIDVRHYKAIRWAERLGFRLDDPEPFGPFGLPFRRFRLSRGDLNV